MSQIVCFTKERKSKDNFEEKRRKKEQRENVWWVLKRIGYDCDERKRDEIKEKTKS